MQKDPNQVLDIEEAAANVGWHEREVPIRAALLRWYLNHRRKLPWRGDPSPWTRSKARPSKQGKHQIQRTLPGVFGKLNSACRPAVIDLDEEDTQKEEQCFHRSAYGVWISEVMLQQTQVEVVIDYWTTWMRSFPSVPALAAASADEVNAVWAGLGFYGRARRLHEGAKYLLEKHDGDLAVGSLSILMCFIVLPMIVAAHIIFQNTIVVFHRLIRCFFSIVLFWQTATKLF